jgi:hypothetical protein
MDVGKDILIHELADDRVKKRNMISHASNDKSN